jgi:hypothetical protein
MMTKLPELPELELADEAIVYQGSRRLEYESLQAVVFEVRPLLQNRLARAFYGIDVQVPLGSSSYSPKLALYLSNGEVIWISRGWDFVVSESRAEAICAAAEFLSERTFDRRFGKYREEVKRSGCFYYGKYQFCRNGDVLKSGKPLCNVRDPSVSVLLGPFHIHIGQKRTHLEKLLSFLGQSGVTIVISKDRDCFLSMYRLLYGISWEDEHYRDGSSPGKQDL